MPIYWKLPSAATVAFAAVAGVADAKPAPAVSDPGWKPDPATHFRASTLGRVGPDDSAEEPWYVAGNSSSNSSSNSNSNSNSNSSSNSNSNSNSNGGDRPRRKNRR